MKQLLRLANTLVLILGSAPAFAQEGTPISANMPDLPDAPSAVSAQVAQAAALRAQAPAHQPKEKSKIADYIHVEVFQGTGAGTKIDGHAAIDYEMANATFGKVPLVKQLAEHGLKGLNPGKFIFNINVHSSAIAALLKKSVVSNAVAGVALAGAQEQTQITQEVTAGVTTAVTTQVDADIATATQTIIQGVDNGFLQQLQQMLGPQGVTCSTLTQCLGDLPPGNDPYEQGWFQNQIASTIATQEQLNLPTSAQIQQDIADGIKQGVQQALPPILAQLNAALAQQDAMIKQRAHSSSVNALAQDVDVMVGKVSNDGKWLAFARVGKFSPETSATVDETGRSREEWALGGAPNPAQRLNVPYTTGAATVGAVRAIGSAEVGLSATSFHSAPGFVNQPRYTGNLFGMSDADYRKMSKIGKFNSSDYRLDLRTKNGSELYASGGKNGGKAAYSGGGNLNVGGTAVYADFAKGGYTGPDETGRTPSAYSGLVTQRVTKRVTLHAGEQVEKNVLAFDLSTGPDNTVSLRRTFAGANFTLLGTKPDSHFNWHVVYDYGKTKDLGTTDHTSPEFLGNGSSVTSGLTYRFGH